MAKNTLLMANLNIQDMSYLQDIALSEVYQMSDASETIEVGTVSSRGQIAIPSNIREKMHLKEGEKVLFMLEGDALLMKKVSNMSWSQLTEPLVKAKKKIKEEEVVAFVKKIRKE